MENKLYKENKLFLITIGGKVQNSNIENHDVRWLCGKSIKDTFSQLRKEWIGMQKGLHIDSYVAINYIDGYKVKVSHCGKSEDTKSNPDNINYLWFVNLGGYDRNYLNEIHHYGLTVASSAKKAKENAKINWRFQAIQSHCDNLNSIDLIKDVDNCKMVKLSTNYKIILEEDPLGRNQFLRPDWYGYLRIDL